MSDILFSSVMSSGTVTGQAFLLSTVASLLIGAFLGWVYSRQHRFSQSFLITLIMLPATVQLVIMLVNGNVGTGVAVAGAFSLVRFRSTPGTGQEITGIFIAMAVGLATGMGYLVIAALFALILSGVYLIATAVGFGAASKNERILKITIPENLDYETVFDDVLSSYTEQYELFDVRTAAMGSLYKLSYRITPKANASIKDMIDALRVRNGNLEISCAHPVARADEL